ncbi:MAG: FHA domain-containing protein [Bryobacteraceae bacterium]
MAISEWIEKLGRAVFESPFDTARISRDAPELAEIRLAVLDEVKAKSHRVAGRDVFPFNVVKIRIGGVPDSQSNVLRSAFFTAFFEQELRGGLKKASYRFPENLRVEIDTTAQLPGPKESWLSVETFSREQPAEPAGPMRKAARLTVMKGTANDKDIVLTKARTNIGRTVDVYRADGPSRRNDLAFTEENEISRSVSREHAHILFDKGTGEYRLFNDRRPKPGAKDGCGLWIIRDGLSLEVHHNSRGTSLKAGDEIHLGRAMVRFRG